MTATRPRRLVVWLYGNPIATIDQDRRRRVTLTYLPSPTGDTAGPRLSVSMPRTIATHPHVKVDAFLANLLPDRPTVLARWRTAVGTSDPTPFGLLAHVGGDVAGAARFLPEGTSGSDRDGGLQPLTDTEIADRIDRVAADYPTWGQGASHGQFSLAGAQAKIALHRHGETWGVPSGSLPTTHILKPSMPTLADQDLDEHLTMTAARLAGLPAAPTEITEFAGRRVLVVTRFDRVATDGGWTRVHQEDFCQALGRRPDRKYQAEGGPTPAQIASLLDAEVVDRDRRDTDLTRFADALIVNWVMVGTDAHAKNYAILHGQDATVRLAPLYDLNSFLPYRRAGASVSLSMLIGGVTADADAVDRFTWDSCARDLLLPVDLVRARVGHLLTVLPDAVSQAAADPAVTSWGSPLPARLVDTVAARAQVLATAL